VVGTETIYKVNYPPDCCQLQPATLTYVGEVNLPSGQQVLSVGFPADDYEVIINAHAVGNGISSGYVTIDYGQADPT
jgi:hypothetical protein